MNDRPDHNRMRHARGLSFIGATFFVSGCVSRQSVLHPAGEESSEVALLFWIMAAGGAGIWFAVMGTAIYGVLATNRTYTEKFAERFIFFGGIVFPTVTLAALLAVGLHFLPSWGSKPAPGLRVHVTAEQFWWRIEYEHLDGRRTESANEIHLPAGQVTEFVIKASDVIHSFWIPTLGGKMDAIPGRTNLLRLTPITPGTYRGVCAEFCGMSHALMAFVVVVHPADEFHLWLAREAAPAQSTTEAAPLANAGCLACHTIRGISANGKSAPDLTHVASRQTIAAGTRANTRAELSRWLTHPEKLKPDVRMPGYPMLDDRERHALVDILMELR